MIYSVTNSRTGNGTMYLGSSVRGKILAVKVVAGAVTASSDLTMTGETTGIPILTDITVTASTTTWYYPRALVTVHTTGDVSAIAVAEIPVLSERISCVIAEAGTAADVAVTVIFETNE